MNKLITTIVLAIVWLGGTASHAVAQDDAAARRLENLSRQEMLDLGERLAVSERVAEARAILSALALHEPDSRERWLLESIVASAEGRDEEAEAICRRLLAHNPEDTRVRLELARILFQLRRFSGADYHFRLAAADNPPREVLQNISLFRQTIRAERLWRVSLEAGIAPDTNINSASREQVVELFGLPFTVADDAREQSGVGLFGNADVEVRLRRHSNLPVVIRGYGSARQYGGSEYDDTILGGEAGPQFRAGNARVTVSGTMLWRWYGGDLYMRAPGVSGRLEWLLSPVWQLDAQLQHRWAEYPDSPSQAGTLTSAGLNLGRAVGAAAYVQWNAFATRKTARLASYCYNELGTGVSFSRELPMGIDLTVGIDGARAHFDGIQFGFMRERRDRRATAELILMKRNWLLLGFSPVVRLSHTRQWSNIDFYSYRRTRVEWAMQRPF